MKQSIVQYVMIVLLIVGAYFLGVYKTKTEYLESSAGPAQQPAQPQQQVAPSTVDMEQIKAMFDGKHITFGDKDAKTIITEVSDPSCPYCHIAGGLHPELNNSSEQFKMVKDGGSYVPPVPEIRKLVESGETSFLFLYSNGHGSGEVATQLLYCAYDQGKFWEAHDILMTKTGYDLMNDIVKNDLTKSSKLVAQVAKVLDSKALQSCLDSGKYEGQPAEDMAFVQSLGFEATPTFFVNDKVVEGAQPWSSFEGFL